MIRRLIILLLIVGCEEPSQHGCLDSQACNYDADATIDNNSCEYVVDCADVCGGDKLLDNCEVCDDDSTNDCIQDECGVWGGSGLLDNCGVCDADTTNDCTQDNCGVWDGDDSTCTGCADLNGCNYNSSNTIDDGSCIYPQDGYDCQGYSVNDMNILQEFLNLNLNFDPIGSGLLDNPENWENGRLIRIRILIGSHFGLSVLPENIGSLTELKYLTIVTGSSITLPTSIWDLSKLIELTLVGMEISSLPNSISNLSNLTHLNLSENQLTTLPDSIGDLSNLVLFRVDHNQLTSIPESICDIYSYCQDTPYWGLRNNSLCGDLPTCLQGIDIGTQSCP